MDTNDVSADNTALAAETNTAGESPASQDALTSLDNFFKAQDQDSTQVDNSGETAGDGSASDAGTADNGQPGQKTPATTQDAADSQAGQPAEGEQAPEDAANFDALDNTAAKKFVETEDEVKARFPRNLSKEASAHIIQVGQTANRLTETIDRLGGEHFVPALEKVSAGLQQGNSASVFEGVVSAASSEGLLNLIGDTLDLAFLQADSFAKEAETAQFGSALRAIAEAAIQRKFGESVSMESLSRLTQLAEIGWLEKIDKWTTDGWVDRDEADELIKAANDPKALAIAKENARLKAELEKKAGEASKAEADKANELEGRFHKTVTDNISKTLHNVVLPKSILRDLATDTPEMKEQKALIRSTIEQKAVEAFQALESSSDLLKGFKQGKYATGVYQTQFVNAVNSALLQVKAQTALAEKMFAKMYGNTRNGQLANKISQQQQPANQPNLEPTVPQQKERSSGEKSTADIQKDLEQGFAMFG